MNTMRSLLNKLLFIALSLNTFAELNAQSDSSSQSNPPEIVVNEVPEAKNKKETLSLAEKEALKAQKKLDKSIAKFNKKVRKAEDDYLRGFYSSAYGRFNQIYRKESKKDTTSHIYMAAILRRAKYDEARGEFVRANDNIQKGYKLFMKYGNPTKPLYFESLQALSEAANAYGSPLLSYNAIRKGLDDVYKIQEIKSNSISTDSLDSWLNLEKKEVEISRKDFRKMTGSSFQLDSSLTASFVQDSNQTFQIDPEKEYLISLRHPDSLLAHNFNELLIQTQAKRGNYVDAIARCEKALFIRDTFSEKKQWERNLKKNKYTKKRVKRKIRNEHKVKAAELLVLKAELHRKYGDYKKAEVLYTLNERLLPNYVKGNSFYYFLNWYGQANLLEDMGNDKDARKDILDLYKNMKSSNQISRYHKLYYATMMDLATAYLMEGKDKKYIKTAKKLRDEVRLKYGNNNPYSLDAQLTINEKFVKKKPKKANRKIARIEKKAVKIIPHNHPFQKDFNNQLYEIALRRSNYTNAKLMLERNNTLDSLNYGIDAPFYHYGLLEQAQFEVVYTNDFATADSIYKMSFDNYARTQLHPYHKHFLPLLFELSAMQMATDRFDAALTTLEEAELIAIKKFGNNSEVVGAVYEKKAMVFIKKSEFVKAQELLEKADVIIRKDAGRRSLNYAKLLRTLGELYALNGDFSKAQSAIKEAQRIMRRLGEDTGPEVSSTDELVELYLKTGRYDLAEDLIQNSIELRTSKLGENHFRLISPYNQLGRLRLIQGDFVLAEKAAQTALNIALVAASDTSSRYNENLSLLAEVYKEMGDFENAKKRYIDIIANNKKIFGDNSVKVAESYLRLARIKLLNKDLAEEIKTTIDSAQKIIEPSLGTKHPLYASALELKAEVNVQEGNYDEALKQLSEAKIIWLESYGSRHINVGNNDKLTASLYYAKKEYSKAIDNYDEALKVYKKIFNKTHPKYIKTLTQLAFAHYANKDFNQALAVINEANESNLEYIQKYFPALSDKEKNSYWASIRPDFEFFNSLAINMHRENPKVLSQMYDNKLATKAILLSSSLKVRERILNSGDEELISEFVSWMQKKELLTNAVSMSIDELQSNNISLAQLEKEINSLEKSLSEKSEAFKSNSDNKSITWKDVVKTLKDDEVAIEIIRTNYFTNHFSDSVIYAFLILNNKSKKGPELVVIGNGNELEGKYYNYYRNVIKYKAKDKNSYDQYWQPINDKIAGKNKIFVSPDGIYNQLNIETFRKPNDRFLIEDYLVYTISNTKDLVLHQDRVQRKYPVSTVALFGNPSFSDSDSENDGDLRNKNAVSSIEPLPGAENEINAIKAILEKNNWIVNSYLQDEATEGLVKSKTSPRVIHIATHGFFMETNTASSTLGAESITDNPLLKSGLLFADAADLLAENNIYNFNKKDGILTAYEAMNLSLDETELVVLSACETGLGEIQSGEGVFGLQRSFIVAGANNVIMTLFKVDDNITMELMSAFYDEWSKTGNKREAFVNAKIAIKQKYEAAIYWGSFVMIGLD